MVVVRVADAVVVVVVAVFLLILTLPKKKLPLVVTDGDARVTEQASPLRKLVLIWPRMTRQAVTCRFISP